MKIIMFLAYLVLILAGDLNYKKKLMATAEWESLRVSLDFAATLERVKNGEIKVEDYYSLEKDLKTLKSYFEGLFKVKRNPDNLKIESNQCGELNIPPKLASDGAGVPDTDFYLFVLFEDKSELTDNDVAVEGSVCSYDSVTNRPVSGVVKVSKNQRSLIKPIFQELLSLFGFSFNQVDLFVDPSTSKPLKTDQILSKTELNGEELVVSIGKNSLKQAKLHFNCPKLQGIPFSKSQNYIESRWDRRYMNTDIMTESNSIHFELSAITLGFLEDTGWFKPDYSQATSFQWGRNSGCSFFTQPCLKKGSPAKSPFCSEKNKQTCSFDYKFKGTCAIKVYNTSLPPVFQYFKDSKAGGTDKALNYCPVVKEEEYCFTEIESSSNKERKCRNCACFTEIERNESKPKCYKFKCVKGNISVFVDKHEIKCKQGQAKYQAKRIVCPPAEVICSWAHEWV